MTSISKHAIRLYPVAKLHLLQRCLRPQAYRDDPRYPGLLCLEASDAASLTAIRVAQSSAALTHAVDRLIQMFFPSVFLRRVLFGPFRAEKFYGLGVIMSRLGRPGLAFVNS
jgi:hypothetical protein